MEVAYAVGRPDEDREPVVIYTPREAAEENPILPSP